MMMHCSGWRRRVASGVGVALTVLLAITGCFRPAPPTATPPPTSTPSSVSAEVNIYLMMVAPVTSATAILYAQDQPVSVLQELVAELQLIDPPAEMTEAHQLLQEGYGLILEGALLMDPRPDPELRAEAHFIQDWGVRQLWEHRRVVAEFKAQAEADEP